MEYFNELKRSMDWLGQKNDTFFLGQAVDYEGTAITNTLKDVPDYKKTEMPVNEDMQMGATIGVALGGTVPISIFPRWNFLLLATNQIVNHLDKLDHLGWLACPIIIRTSIGSQRPLHPQYQHIGDFTAGFRAMCDLVNVVRLDEPHQIFSAYERAYQGDRPTILVEYGDYYNEK